ncbi:hypothetical protein FGL89_04615 [Leuconostoc carnosum]|uniref:DUF6314 domain-containing protein n=2 Tax=Leuconostoc carnosum TaxID=1252 RepID=K0D549_LEUCJ|nr:DUF6314 family protein [Leuconostoc carnosum]AFT80969.1 hypothetical protein C270_00250 [Leuconostoc carnosum JB16]KAA8332335.1 hypothetical protein FE409_00190 [Leuconostoc carnosum]QEA33466.1 hypothetical protein FGL89_04615 [Leuconostoc carnosum]
MMNLKQFFSGQWDITRTITDSDKRLYATVRGTANFCHHTQNALILEEKGQVSLVDTGRNLDFTRQYIYVFDQQGMSIYFHDDITANNGLYQAYDWDDKSKQLQPRDKYLCSLDVYDAQFHLENAKTFWQNTDVVGPHKDYHVKTIFTRKNA